MCVAPARRAAMMTSAPIGPQPVTRTFFPSSGPARCTPCSATESGSAIAQVVGQQMRLVGLGHSPQGRLGLTAMCWSAAKPATSGSTCLVLDRCLCGPWIRAISIS